MNRYHLLHKVLLGHIMGRSLQLFPKRPESQAASPPPSCYYVWQFLALLVRTLSDEQRHALVLDLRPKVLEVLTADKEATTALAASADNEAAMARKQATKEQVDDMNLFLNAIGLDAAQLA